MSFVRLTPGNVGAFQPCTPGGNIDGADKDSAVAVAFLISIIQYIPVTLIGLVSRARWRRRSTHRA
jgi:hypothetical protein